MSVASAVAHSSAIASTPFLGEGDARLRVDGKYFARRGQRFRLQGVTYGPFAPNSDGERFPARSMVRRDLAQMLELGVNAIRTYHQPPAWLLELCQQSDVSVLVDIPWSKHLCFLDSAVATKSARQAVRDAVSAGRDFPCLAAYSIGNEIPPDIVRWHGRQRVEQFLTELGDVARQADPACLVTYANYPPTEYLDLSSFDFVTFNVYLHDPETFHRYLLRLQNLVGDRPLVLGELGMDSLRHGELEQANFLASHLREMALVGTAGSFVFSWTDEWHAGNQTITDWAFGVTRADRTPKAASHAVREVFEQRPHQLLTATPRVSVVVCSFNGGRTLSQCLRSLAALDYPDYEVIVVDDGSTDDTPQILEQFPDVRAIRQANQGLSVARNAGLHAATGSVIAYTDSDCFADGDWLARLVAQLDRGNAAAVGGPNLAPDDGRVAACIAAGPGQPMHVLESDQVAEHIPGCNMAFRREALEAINGFDSQFRKAGDDVDVCWRLQQAGYWITFAPGAFVWHHRRQTAFTYMRQQAGYGEAEALLRFKHREKFNGHGHGIWRGVLYGASLQGLVLSRPVIYHGIFATGLFQCIYQRGPAHWAMLPTTLEWHFLMLAVASIGMFFAPLLVCAGVMLFLSIITACLQAAQARIKPEHGGFRSRLLIAAVCYAQPLVRSWARYRTRCFGHPTQRGAALKLPDRRASRLSRTQTAEYWGSSSPDRTELLGRAIEILGEHRCGLAVDTGWSGSDLEIFSGPWSYVQVCTAQEEHGAGQRLIRVRARFKLSKVAWIVVAAGLLAAAFAAAEHPLLATCIGSLTALGAATLWIQGARLTASVAGLFDQLAGQAGLIVCGPKIVRHSTDDQCCRGDFDGD